MEAGVNKVYLEIGGRYLIEYSLETVIRNELVTEVVLVIRPDDVERIEQLNLDHLDRPSIRTTFGGATRHESEYAGISALRAEIENGHLDVVAVHDAARPFMSDNLLRRALLQAASTGSALPGCPVTDTLFLRDAGGFAEADHYVWVQTPQVFDARTLLAAHDAAAAAGYQGVDTAEVVHSFSEQAIELVDGEPSNIKVTYPGDLSSDEPPS